MPSFGGNEEDGDAPDVNEDENKKPIGSVEFLFKIAQGSPNEESDPSDPSDPRNFKAKIDALVTASKDLRVDLDQWDAEQQKLAPSDRKAPPCVVLSTVHSVKGAQWKNATVVMAGGVFPFQPKPKPGDEYLTPEQQEKKRQKEEAEFLTERQLAYVAMTRAAKNLTIVSPVLNAYGREAGQSRFTVEAGLIPGQNVTGKADPTPELAAAATTASAEEPEVEAEDWREASDVTEENWSAN